ncbi:hypothetical protein ANN_17539 [Periplaneta americana]|uniref:Transposase Tc1-like domain-containing protein n=1 Tax=Periplaneta americana TaxID=6978 RepID=A0ABQ8ST76_PERAM|nr:hypothetical protein ANN_17539 [Periplaneta americana]
MTYLWPVSNHIRQTMNTNPLPYQFETTCKKVKMTLSPMIAARAVALVEDDRSLRYVAQVLHTTPSMVSRTVQSEWTVRRRLHDADLISRRSALGPELTRQHRQARFQFAREHEEWADKQWGTVLSSDESRFCLRFQDGRERAWTTGKRRDGGARLLITRLCTNMPGLNPKQLRSAYEEKAVDTVDSGGPLGAIRQE